MNIIQSVILGIGLLLSIIGMKVRYDKTKTDHEPRKPMIAHVLIMVAGLLVGCGLMVLMSWKYRSIIPILTMMVSIVIGVIGVVFLIMMEWSTSIRWTQHDDVVRFWLIGSTVLLGVIVLAMGLPYITDSIISIITVSITALFMYVMTQAEDWHIEE